MPIPVISVAQMREWEALTWAAGQTDEDEVIRRVGHALAQRTLRLTRAGDTVLILAGKGNNGADARATGEFLEDRQVILMNVTEPDAALDEFLHRTERSDRGTGLNPFADGEDPCPALIIDGLFGIGLNRALDAAWKNFITAVNESSIPVLAVDAPSGLNVETGGHFGAAMEATVTLTVGAPKIGLLAQTAWPFVGRLEVADDVGLSPRQPASELNWTLPQDFSGYPPRRTVAGNKGSFGHVAIIAGSFGFHGAAVLTARGAQRAQPGLVTVFPQENIFAPVAAQLQAAMVSAWRTETVLPEKTTCALIGPGLAAPEISAELKAFTQRLWREATFPVVVDASALDWLEPQSAPAPSARIITPHPGEAARLLGTTAAAVQADRVTALRELSKKFGNCWVVLKGHQTLIGCAEGKIYMNPSGNAHLAQGGSGDLLAGFIAGLLAQPSLVEKTLRYAVWQHGAAADKLTATRGNWTVEDLAAEIGNAR